MSKSTDLTGLKFNKLTVTSKAKSKNGKSYWNCICECGNKTIVSGSNLKNNSVKSCGCLKKHHSTHHLSKTRIYRIWRAMINRCYNKNFFAYKYYGGKGIKMCDDWHNDFLSFYKWATANGYDNELTIDRIDNSKGYYPENCRFVNREIQANNRSFCKMITYNGKTQNLTQWCKELKIDYKLVYSRISTLGWTFEKAISTPVKPKNERRQ